MKKLFALLSALSVLSLVVAPVGASAASLRSGETITIQDKVDDDVYAAGENITVNGDINGDLIGMSGIVFMDGSIAGDALVTGGTLTIGNVGDDLRAAGGNITLNGIVGDDAFIAGGTLHVTSEAQIKGSTNLAGGAVIFDATTDGKVHIGAGDVQINGVLNGAATIRADRITINGKLGGETTLAARQIIIGEGAEIAGSVRYWQENGAISADSAIKGGSFTFDDSLKIQKAGPVFPVTGLLMFVLLSMLGSALVLALFVIFDKGHSEKAARLLSSQYWKSLLTGVLFYIVTPIVALILCVTVIGIPLGLFTLFVYGFTLYAAPIIAALVMTKWIDLRRTKQFGKWATFGIALGLLVALRAVAFIPFVGGILILLIVPAALGAKLQVLKTKSADKK